MIKAKFKIDVRPVRRHIFAYLCTYSTSSFHTYIHAVYSMYNCMYKHKQELSSADFYWPLSHTRLFSFSSLNCVLYVQKPMVYDGCYFKHDVIPTYRSSNAPCLLRTQYLFYECMCFQHDASTYRLFTIFLLDKQEKNAFPTKTLKPSTPAGESRFFIVPIQLTPSVIAILFAIIFTIGLRRLF